MAFKISITKRKLLAERMPAEIMFLTNRTHRQAQRTRVRPFEQTSVKR